jgi:ankyrin repeat protein
MTMEYAAWIGNIELVSIRVTQPQYRKQNFKRWTALHSAVWNMHTDIVGILLENDIVDLEVKSNEGWTVLFLATMNDDLRIAKMLLIGGSDADLSTITETDHCIGPPN